MRSAQQVIKYFALALAAILIFAIISGIVSLISLAGFVTWGGDDLGDTSVIWTEGDSKNELQRLSVSAGAANVRFVTVSEAAEPVRVESNSEYIESWQDGNTLNVVEKTHTHWPWNEKSEVVIYVRKGVKFDQVELVVKAGTLNIEELAAAELKLELGAGKTYIGNLRTTSKTRIDGGAGLVQIRGGELRNLDLEVGAGKAEVTARISGDSAVEAGVGKLELNLIGEEDDYKMTIDKGIGSVTLDGRKLEDGGIYGQGENLLKIESGVGAVEIKTVAE